MPVSTNRTSKRQKIVIRRNFPGWTVGPGLTEVLQPDTLHQCLSKRVKEIGILSLIFAEFQVDVWKYIYILMMFTAFVCFLLTLGGHLTPLAMRCRLKAQKMEPAAYGSQLLHVHFDSMLMAGKTVGGLGPTTKPLWTKSP